ncbi:MAG TPA: CAP domain-containing protein [Sandaracinaceae bacterium LLY-WYZ-13_1]|nr:CAP domain-containing protein [Sandaracinaceae bacterium LLY-WYZ-13_1]
MRRWLMGLAMLGALGCTDMPPGGAACDDPTLEVCRVFELVNEERADAGLAPYAWNPELALAAQRHAEDMVDQGYFDHQSLDGRSFGDRAFEAGYDGSPRGENIAAGQRSAEQVMDSWMSSGGHRANILSEGSNEIGVGFEANHWVQVFGTGDRADE